MSTMPGKPEEWFVATDTNFRPSALVSATSQAGPMPGPPVPASTNTGAAVPVLSGSPAANAAPLRLAAARAGPPGVGEWGWRRQADATDQFRGQDEPRYPWGHHSPMPDSDGSINAFACYAPAFRRVVVGKINETDGTTVTIGYRDVDADRYDQWTTTTWSLTGDPVRSGEHNAQAIDLPDGTLLLVVRTDPGSGSDFDVYKSADGGLTWRLALRELVQTFNPADETFPAHSLTSQFRLKRAGEWIRLCWVTGGDVITFYSTDRGISWARIGDELSAVAYDTTATDDQYPMDLLPVDDVGGFLLVVQGAASLMVHYTASGDSAWGVVPPFITVTPGTMRTLYAVRTPSHLYEFAFYKAGGGTGYRFRRLRVGLDPLGDNWEQAEDPAYGMDDTGVQYAPGPIQAVWCGDRMFFYGRCRDATSSYTAQAFSFGWYLGGWTRRPVWRYRPSNALEVMDEQLFERFWSPEVGRPDEPSGSSWTASGGGSGVCTLDRLRIESTIGNPKSYQLALAAASGPSWGQDEPALFVWWVKLDSGDGTLLVDEVAVNIVSQNQADDTQLDLTVRMSGSGLVVYDNVAADYLESVSMTMDHATRYVEVRLAMRKVGSAYKAQLAAQNLATGEWVVSAVMDLTADATSGANSVRFGNIAAPASGTTGSQWRGFMICEGSHAHQYAFDNPDDVVGYPMIAAPPVRIEQGISASWSGLGGSQGDVYDADVLYRNGVGQLGIDSPRFSWRSTDATAQALIFDAGGSSGLGRWVHNAAAVFGCNNRTVLIDYDSDPAFPSPVTKTIDLTRLGTGTTAAQVVIGNGTAAFLLPTGTNQWATGELVGMYMRAVTGAAAGLTWKITKHDAENVVHCEEESVALSAQGLGVGDTVLFFGPNGSLQYATASNHRYMRIRLADADVAEGVHILGTVVVGVRQEFGVPFDWARTDSEQPNVSTYRTRGAVAWGYVEGPPQRTWQGRVIGDTDERQREALRGILRQIGYEARPVAWIFDDERRAEVVLVRVTNGSNLDQQGRFRDANDVIRASGDQTVILTEEP